MTSDSKKPYLFYVQHQHRDISDLHVRFCDDDQSARDEAWRLLSEGLDRNAVEVFEEDREVGRFDRTASLPASNSRAGRDGAEHRPY